MPLISDSLKAQVKERFSRVVLTDVRIIHFTEYDVSPNSPLTVMRSPGRQYYEETRILLREVADLSDRIHLEIHDIAADPEGASQYGVDKVPATILTKGSNRRVRFFGFPSGNQFSALVEAIGDVARSGVPMSGATKDALQVIPNPVHIQVFVTPN